jgi:hypothetical protein
MKLVPVTDWVEKKGEEDKHKIICEFAFHNEVAKEIKERDNWRCECGRGGKVDTGGYKLHASHIDHDRRNPYYNNPDNGKTLCIGCHLHEHLGILRNCEDEDFDWAWNSVRLLAENIWQSGMHTKAYYYKHKMLDVLVEDRREMIAEFEFWELDVKDFIDC